MLLLLLYERIFENLEHGHLNKIIHFAYALKYIYRALHIYYGDVPEDEEKWEGYVEHRPLNWVHFILENEKSYHEMVNSCDAYLHQHGLFVPLELIMVLVAHKIV